MSDLDELFPEVEVAQVPATPVQPTAAAAGWFNIGLALLIGALACFLCLRYVPQGGHSDRGDRQEQVEPVRGGFLVFVSDRRNITLEQDLLMREMDQFSAEHKLERQKWIDDSDEPGQKLVEFAASKGVQTPLVAYVQGGQIKRVAAWPSGEAPEAKAKLEKFLK